MNHLKRLHEYNKDRYPYLSRMLVGAIMWFELYFIVILNLIFMPNRWFCLFLYTYGSLMAVWFFQKHKIQPNLPAALFTHNPVQIVMNLYTLSYVVMVYGLKWVTLTNFLAIFTLYFPALIWEVSRKIRAPKDETDYVTYSKLFGYKKAINFVLIVTWIDIITRELGKPAVVGVKDATRLIQPSMLCRKKDILNLAVRPFSATTLSTTLPSPSIRTKVGRYSMSYFCAMAGSSSVSTLPTMSLPS